MRLKFVLKSESLPLKIPVNYQHLMLRNIIEYYDPIKENLHLENEIANQEHLLEYFKYICFSHLHLFKPHFEKGQLVSSKEIVWFYVSSPIDSLIAHLLTLNLVGNSFEIGGNNFIIDKISLVNPPPFKRKLIGEALSPLSLCIFLEERHSPTYLNWNDSYWGYHIKKNLIRKYELLYDKKPDDTYLEFNWDFSRGEPKSRLITLEKLNENEFKVRGWMGKFMLKGSKQLLKLAWEWGLGEKNYLGFGMWHNVAEKPGKWKLEEHHEMVKSKEVETVEY